MTITIARTQFTTTRPADLDAALIATTGCNAAENLQILAGTPLPGRVAAAIAPFLDESGPSVAELAALIEADMREDASTIVAAARRLFVPADAMQDPPALPGDTEGS